MWETNAGWILASGFSSAVLMVPAGASTAVERDPLIPVWVGSLKGDNGFRAVVAPDAKNVWAFGATRSAGKAKPLVYRKSGSTWKKARLPSGLKGGIQAADASSASNVWAVGGGSFDGQGSAYLLHWNGERWKLAKRWKSAFPLTVASSGRGVWVFDSLRSRALRFDGRRWHKAKTPIPVWGAAARGKTVWAWGLSGHGKAEVVRFDGRRWRPANPGTLLPKQTEDSATAFTEPVFVGKDVWMVANHIVSWTAGNPKGGSFLLRHENGRWRKEKTRPASGLGHAPIPDGRGGFWVTVSKKISGWVEGDLEYDLVLTHRTATGRWSERLLGHIDEETAGVAEFVRVPGTQRLLGVGSVEPPGKDKDAAIFELS